jgi:drug/metabolite transporter (DMT)-like permease
MTDTTNATTATPADSSARTRPSRALPYFLLVLVTLFWGGNWVVGRALNQNVPPVALAFWRWMVALALLLPFAAAPLARDWPRIREHWKSLALLGLLGTGMYNVLAYGALQYTTATNGALFNSLLPILIIVLSRLILGHKLTGRQSAGVAVSLCGALLIIARADLATLTQFDLNRGDVMLILGMLVWALYTVALRWRPEGLHPLSFLAAIIAFGLAACVPLYLWEIASGRLIVATTGALAGIAYAGVFPALLAYIFWNYSVQRVGPNIAGLFTHLVPVFGVFLSAIFLGESLHAYHLGGMALVFAGIYLTSSA